MVAMLEAAKLVQDCKAAVKAAETALEDAQHKLFEAIAETQTYVQEETEERNAADAAKRQRAEQDRMQRSHAMSHGEHGHAPNGAVDVHDSSEQGMDGVQAAAAAAPPPPEAASHGADAAAAGQGDQMFLPMAPRASGISLKPFTFKLSDAS